MSDDQYKGSLKTNLKKFLIKILEEESREAPIGVVRKELADELTQAVGRGFKSDQILRAMTSGIETTFKSPQITEAVSGSFGPAINSAAERTMGEYIRRIEARTDLQGIRKELTELRASLDRMSDGSELADLINQMAAVTGDVQGLKQDLASSHAKLDILTMGLQGLMDQVQPGQIDLAAMAEEARRKEAAKKENGPTGAAPKKTPKELGLLLRRFLPYLAVVVLTFLAATWIGNIGKGNKQGQGPIVITAPDPQPVEAKAPPKAVQPDPAGSDDETRRAEGLRGGFTLNSSDAKRVEAGLKFLSDVHADGNRNPQICATEALCPYTRFWPETGEVREIDKKNKFLLAQEGILYKQRVGACADASRTTGQIAADGVFGTGSLSAAEAVYACETEAGRWKVPPRCARDDAKSEILCNLPSVPFASGADPSAEDALAFWIIWTVGGEQVD